MQSLLDFSRVKRMLCLGAHCGDIEIGAGGTMLRLVEAYPHLEVRWVVFGGEDPVSVNEERRSAGHLLAGVTKSEVTTCGFRDGFLPFQGEQVKEAFEEVKSTFAPDIILTHHDDDRDHDHRLVSQLTWNTWRDHVIFEYEITEHNSGLGRPNLFVPLPEELCRNKMTRLFEAFPSQAERRWFNEDVLWALLRLRGVECNAPSRLAEAFFVRRIVA
jgi:LmbE family N-acetylglucosaminyl deacetylase